jgi:hypothetical protein
MKFMTSWKLHPDTKMDAFASFSQMTADDDAGDHGPEIKLIGRWHDVASGTGVAITECESGAALAAWIYNWGPMLDANTVPVLDDEEVRAVVSAKLAAQQ